MTDATRDEVCVVAVAECFRGDGERLCNPIGTIPMIGGRLARESFEPDLVMTDGFAMFAANPVPVGVADPEVVVESWNPYPQMFSVLWNGKRHVMMGASQMDPYGNQNFACIGDWHRPKAQLLGFRGAPGNTINHTTSYFIPNQTPKVFVEHVDVVCGVGYDRAAELGPVSSRFHDIRRVVTNLGTFDFATPDHRMRLRSVHPGVSVQDVIDATGFDLVVDEFDESRLPTEDELRLIRDVLDPNDTRKAEVRG